MTRPAATIILALFLAISTLSSSTAGPAPRPGTLALVVGSNRGGPGQEDLRFAEDDARKFAEVLTELGGYDPSRVKLLASPGKAGLLGAISEARSWLEAEERQGNPTVFTFFYSGHARSSALSLGPEELSLPELREQLLSLPATVTIAILDACQTGAISQIKGSEPAADFSFNSVNDLNASGVAIMASSAGSELSQESEALGSSYFTHHLLVGLRGAADTDGDGRVTLSEAYRYAYNRTLVSTASTAVGKQHVTLENDLKGKGEMVLTSPAEASAHLEMPSELVAELLLQRNPSGTVVAEVNKVAGEAVRLGLPAGSYAALVKIDGRAYRCEIGLDNGLIAELQLEGCSQVPVEEATAKSDDRPRTLWGLELGTGVLWPRSDGFNKRLNDFGFDNDSLFFNPSLSLGFTRSLGRYLTLVVRFDTLELGSYKREISDQTSTVRSQTFDWQTFGLGVFVRGGLPLFDGVLTPYLQVGGGLTLGFTRYQDSSGKPDDRQTFVGYELGAQAGLEFMPWKHFGFFGQVGYGTAPAVKNLMGDFHDSGGLEAALGIRGAW